MPSHQVRNLAASNESLKKELDDARRRLRQRGGSGGGTGAWLPLSSETPQAEEETWFSTYLDMMTLLLVLMLVMLAFAGAGEGEGTQGGGGFTVDFSQGAGAGGEGVLPGAKHLSDDSGAGAGFIADEGGAVALLQEQAKQGGSNAWEGVDFSALGDDIDVILEDESVSFRINSEILFGSGQADLSLAGLGVLKKLLPVLKQSGVMITVEGHTDSVPIRSSRFPSNWELSGARAGSVVRYMESNGVPSDHLRAVGYADTRAIDSNETAEGRANNRRVELNIAVEPDAPLPVIN